MNSADLQFRAILHSYTFRDSFLVYHKEEGCFYTVGDLSKLDKSEYETHLTEVVHRVKEFVQENRDLLDKHLMSEMAKCLNSRIGKLNQRTQGVMGLFTFVYYMFNPYSKNCSQQQKHSLEKLKMAVDDALAELEKNERVEEDLIEPSFSSETGISTEEHLSESPKKEKEELEEIFTDEPTDPKTPSLTHLKTLATMDDQDDDLDTPFVDRINSLPTELIPSLPMKPKTPGRRGSKRPISISRGPSSIHIDPSLSPPPPPPPPPPLPGSGAGVPLPPSALFSLNRMTSSALLPHEPAPLTFDPLNYAKLSRDEVSQQIIEIEKYIEKSQEVLKSFDKPIQEYALLKSRSDELKLRVNEFNIQFKQCQANLQRLKQGEKEGVVVELFYKSTKGYTGIPFYPDDLFQEVLDRNQTLEKESLEKQKKLKQQIESKNQSIENLKKELETLDEKNTKERDSLCSEIAEMQESVEGIEQQLTEVSQITFLDKKGLLECLKFSHVIHLLEVASQKFEDQMAALKVEQMQCENKLQQLSEDCQKKCKMSLSTLEVTLGNKNKNLETWLRNKNARATWLKQQERGIKAIVLSPPKDPSKLSTLFDEYPFLRSLTQLPQNVRVMLKGENFKKENSSDLLNDFNARIYGQLYSKKE